MNGKRSNQVPAFQEFKELYRAVNCPRTPKSKVFDTMRLEHFNETRRKMPPFRCDFFSIMLFLQPGITFKVSAVEQPIAPNTLAFYVPNQIRSFQKSGAWSGYVVYFKSDFIFQDSNADIYKRFPFLDWNAVNFFTLTEQDLASVQPLFEKLLAESESETPFEPDYLHAYLNVLLYECKRLHAARVFTQSLVETRAGRLTRDYENLIREHFRKKKLVQEYAKMLYVSPKHLSKAVKEVTGKPAVALIHDALLLEAKSLLFQSEMTVSQIAHALNFQDYAHFSNFFKQKIGVSPTDFRRERQFLHKIAAF